MKILSKGLTKLIFLLGCFCISMSAYSVNVNTATASEIAKELKGIGPAKAGAIVIYREQNGPFITLKDLSKVKGIGSATVDKNRDVIQFKKNK